MHEDIIPMSSLWADAYNVNSSECTRSTHCILATETNTNQMTISGVKYVWLHCQWCTNVLTASYSNASNSFSFLQWHCKIGMNPQLWALHGKGIAWKQIIYNWISDNTQQQCCWDPIFSGYGLLVLLIWLAQIQCLVIVLTFASQHGSF